jgi:hypothetical protein
MRKVSSEVDLLEAMDLWDVPHELLGKLAEDGKLRSRRAHRSTNLRSSGQGRRREYR